MTSDEERREVARRLRDLPSDMYEVEGKWTATGIDTDCHDQTDYYLIHFVLFGELPAEHMHPYDYEELHKRLADLIEPEPERTCHMVWVSDRDGYECTACGDVFTDDPDDDGRVSAYAASTFSYCPHCGARVVDGNE